MGKKCIYIAGPTTGSGAELFDKYEEWLTAKGHKVINPTAVLPKGLTAEREMRARLGLIDCADLVLFLPGADENAGSLCEFAYCRAVKKPRTFSIHELEGVRS